MSRATTAMLSVFVAAMIIMGCSKSDSESPVQPTLGAQPTVLTATGDIAARVAEFRTLIGDPANGGIAGQQPAGRREVSWDGASARPFNNSDDFPTDFFNTVATVGLVYSGNAFRNDSSLFAEINPTYANEFRPFSPKVMFSAIGTNELVVTFHVAGEATLGVVNGFGVVLADVDLANTTSIELFDKDRRSIGHFHAPPRSDANGLSFVGAKYDSPIVASVKITCGNAALGAGVNDLTSGGVKDLVVVDNVIYGEPNAF